MAPAAKNTTARIRVQSEAGVQQWGQLQEGYNSANERVEIPYVRVLKEDGTVVKAGDDAVQDLSAPVEHEAPVYTDYRQKHITVPGLRPGEILEYVPSLRLVEVENRGQGAVFTDEQVVTVQIAVAQRGSSGVADEIGAALDGSQIRSRSSSPNASVARHRARIWPSRYST